MSSTIAEVTVGLDFGASFTKVSCSFTADQRSITRFAVPVGGVRAEQSYVIPSILYIRPNGERSINNDFESDESCIALRYMKVLLLHDSEWPQGYGQASILQDAQVVMRKANMTVIDALSEFLKLLWAEVSPFICRKLAMSTTAFNRTHLHLVAAVPADWPYPAMDRMKSAIRNSGILSANISANITFMREPAGALIACLNLKHEPQNFQENDLVTVCDIGSITTDITTHGILPPQHGEFRMRECERGGSRLYGGFVLEEAFRMLLRTKAEPLVGHLGPWFWKGADRWWRNEGQVLVLNVSPGLSIDIELKGSEDGGDLRFETLAAAPFGKVNKITFTSLDCAQMTEHVLVPIVDFLHQHLQTVMASCGRLPKAVIVTGGFSSHTKLRSLMLQRFGGSVNLVHIPKRNLVADGAAFQGCRGRYADGQPIIKVGSHIAAAHYGICVGHLTSSHRVAWQIRRGTDLSFFAPLRISLSHDAFQVRPRFQGGYQATLLLRSSTHEHETSGGECPEFASIVWVSPNGRPFAEGDELVLDVLADTEHGLSFHLHRNGQQLPTSEVQVHYRGISHISYV